MAKLIHKNTKKNRDKAITLLNSKTVIVRLPFPKEMTGLEALTRANQLVEDGLLPEALAVADELISSFPKLIDVLLLRLTTLIRLEYLIEAETMLSQLLKQAPQNLGVLQNAIRFYMLVNRPANAMSVLQRALKLSNNNEEFLQTLGEIYEQQGEQDKAVKTYRRVLENSSPRSTAYEHAAMNLAALVGLEPAQEVMIKQVLQKCTSNDYPLAFSLAKNARKNKDIPEEVRWLKAANSLMQRYESERGKKWNLKQIQARREKLKAAFDKAQPDWMQDYYSNREEMPIFILAMPRSGTTLLEQILGAHPALGQTGESRGLIVAVDKQLQKMGDQLARFPENLKQLTHQQLDSIAGDYIANEMLITKEKAFINKNLANHLYVGILATLFPRARFIHLSRDPLDNCLSICQQVIANATYATSVEHTVEAQEEHIALVNYWKYIYPERITSVQYEELVSEGEPVIRRVIEFLGVEWDAEVLMFNERKNLVRTPSMNQVRKGLNTEAIDKWKGYEELLDPARSLFER